MSTGGARRTMEWLLPIVVLVSVGRAQESRWEQLIQAGDTEMAEKRFAQAEKYFREALAEASTGDPKDPRVVDSLRKLVGCYSVQGKVLQQESLSRRILTIEEDMRGYSDPQLVPPLLDLGSLYLQLQRPGDAEPYVRRALEISDSTLGPIDDQTLNLVEMLGQLCIQLRKYTEAEELFLRSFRAHEDMHPPEVTALEHDLENLSAVYVVQGKNAEGEAFSRQALEMRQAGSHAPTGNVARRLGGFYWAQGRFAEAEPLLLAWLEREEKMYGPDHPNVQMCLSELSNFYRIQGRDAEADAMNKRALDIAQKVSENPPGGAADHQAWMSLTNSAAVFMSQGEFARAEELYDRAISMMKKADLPDYPSKARTVSGLGAAKCRQGKYEESMVLFKQSIEMAETAVGRDHPQAAEGHLPLARCLIASGRYQEAETLFQQLIQKFDKPGKPAPPILLRILSEYSRLLRSLDREADAQRVQARLEELLSEVRREKPSPQ